MKTLANAAAAPEPLPTRSIRFGAAPLWVFMVPSVFGFFYSVLPRNPKIDRAFVVIAVIAALLYFVLVIIVRQRGGRMWPATFADGEKLASMSGKRVLWAVEWDRIAAAVPTSKKNSFDVDIVTDRGEKFVWMGTALQMPASEIVEAALLGRLLNPYVPEARLTLAQRRFAVMRGRETFDLEPGQWYAYGDPRAGRNDFGDPLLLLPLAAIIGAIPALLFHASGAPAIVVNGAIAFDVARTFPRATRAEAIG